MQDVNLFNSQDNFNKTVRFNYSRDSIIGADTNWRVSNLGVVQFQNNYSTELLNTICEKAIKLRDSMSAKRHLNLRYIRAAHDYIPEINELINNKERLDYLSDLAETKLEPYPISVIKSIITFMGTEDGVIPWHNDGVPCSELIPLQLDGVEGGELQVFHGNYEAGLSKIERGEDIPVTQITSMSHEQGSSTLGQYMRLLHRVSPITSGTRITLNLNLRSSERPFIDDNSLCYLAADNPDLEFIAEVLDDIKERQLPAYQSFKQAQ